MKKIRLFFGTIFLLLAVSGAAFVSSAETVDLPVQATERYDKAQELLGVINGHRAGYSTEPLTMDSRLMEVAMQRAAELSIYFSHVRPDSHSDVIEYFSGDSIAEDILSGAADTAVVYKSWYDSGLHRGPMLHPDYKYCGIGCVEVESTMYWVLLSTPKSYGSEAHQGNAVENTRTVQMEKSWISFEVWDWRYNDTNESFTGRSVYYGKSAEVGIRIINPGNSNAIFRIYPQYLTYQSDDPAVLRVDANGTVTPVSRGSAHLTVALKSSPDVKTTFPVNVISNTLRKTPTITLSSTSFLETGSEIRPGVTVRDCFGNPMVENRDYRLEYANNKNAGAASVRVYFLGNYSDPSAGNYDFVTKGFYITSNPDLHNPTPGDGEIGGGNTGSGGTSGGTTGSGNTGGTAGGNVGGGTAGATASAVPAGGGGYIAPAPTLPKASLSSLKSAKKKTVTVKWKKKKGISGYQIQYALNKKFTKSKKTKTVAKAKKTSLTIKKLESQKTYYVRIRTYKKVNGVSYYGSWSKTKKVRIK